MVTIFSIFLGLYFHLSVFTGPKHGNLLNSNLGTPVREFSLTELRSGVIGYSHNPKADTGADTLLLQATDGFHVLSFLMELEIRERVKKNPLLYTKYIIKFENL